ncbi:hypothetical protein CRM22_010355 [Opisthorchis felineus]|uniref:Dynein light chain n=1 Tax=Opisthorchis felineus TaxID=147828 RepID=A0A4S2KZ78_OPIFE|nr:hypothetical protein CRM22_010355 [Opisthorchis felineus]
MATLEVEERIPQSAEDAKRVHTYPLIKAAARFVKENVDKKFGSAWHVLIGEDFGFEVTHEVNNLLYMFCGGNLAILVWKCS